MDISMNYFSENKKINTLLDELKKKLDEIFTEILIHAIVFGSYAKGNYNHESDLDVFIVINSDEIASGEDKLLDLAVDLSLKYDLVISAFLESYDNFNKYKTIKPLYAEIQKNGIDINAA